MDLRLYRMKSIEKISHMNLDMFEAYEFFFIHFSCFLVHAIIVTIVNVIA